MEKYHVSERKEGFTGREIEEIVTDIGTEGMKKVLLVVPDYTRYHSNAGLISNIYYHYFTDRGIEVKLLEALGTHEKISDYQLEDMYGDIPFGAFVPHDWRNDVVRIGEVPPEYVSEITEGLWNDSVSIEVNKLIMDESFDLIISIGQVVPHEVIGMSNHSKNIFVGTGGSAIINQSHMIGAVYGMERVMGKDHSPVRKVFDYALEHFLNTRPVIFVLTVTTAEHKNIFTHGIFIGDKRECLERAIALSQEKNIDFVPKSLKKCVVYLDPEEFKSTWLGNKAVYRTRMAMDDGGELIILGKGISRFGEDAQVDALIRKYGYKGRLHTLELLEKNDDLKANMSAAAHLIHGSSDGRFRITYAVENISREEIASVGYGDASYEEMRRKYDPDKMSYGYNEIDGEEVFYIPNPALGLWISETRFREDD